MYKYAQPQALVPPAAEYYARSAAGQDLAIWKLDEQKTTYYVSGTSIETDEDSSQASAMSFITVFILQQTLISVFKKI
jgi:hypothetical protein